MTTEADLKKIVGQRLQMHRLEKCLTQEQMGEKLNLSTSAYCKIEYGETDLTLTRLNKIAEVLNMSAVELFSKIDGNTYFYQPIDCGFVGIARDSSTIKVESNESLRDFVNANTQLIKMLCKRIEILENKNL